MLDEVNDIWLLRLAEEIGPEAVDEVVAIFIEETREGIARLSDGGDDPCEVLHSLSGAAANLGFATLERDLRGAIRDLAQGQEVPLGTVAARFGAICDALERRSAA